MTDTKTLTGFRTKHVAILSRPNHSSWEEDIPEVWADYIGTTPWTDLTPIERAHAIVEARNRGKFLPSSLVKLWQVRRVEIKETVIWGCYDEENHD